MQIGEKLPRIWADIAIPDGLDIADDAFQSHREPAHAAEEVKDTEHVFRYEETIW